MWGGDGSLTVKVCFLHPIQVNFLRPILDPIETPVFIGAVMHALELIRNDDGGRAKTATGFPIFKTGDRVLVQKLFHYAAPDVPEKRDPCTGSMEQNSVL